MTKISRKPSRLKNVNPKNWDEGVRLYVEYRKSKGEFTEEMRTFLTNWSVTLSSPFNAIALRHLSNEDFKKYFEAFYKRWEYGEEQVTAQPITPVRKTRYEIPNSIVSLLLNKEFQEDYILRFFEHPLISVEDKNNALGRWWGYLKFNKEIFNDQEIKFIIKLGESQKIDTTIIYPSICKKFNLDDNISDTSLIDIFLEEEL